MIPHMYSKALVLGVIAGMRASSAPAWAAYARSEKPNRFWTAAAAMEIIGDKLPFVGKRTRLPALLARVAAGGLSALYVNHTLTWRRERIAVFVAGAGAALASSYACFSIRKVLTKKLKVPDPAIAIIEDGLTVYLGRRFLIRNCPL